MFKLTSRHDGFEFQVLRAPASGPRLGGVVVLQEIFGLDAYVSSDLGRWASAGFEAIAPALFDRTSPGHVAAHDSEGIRQGLHLAQVTSISGAIGDIAACVDDLAQRGAVCIVGYCYGGRLAWQAAAELDTVAAASCYYGQIAPIVDLAPCCPTICHFGRRDTHVDAQASFDAIVAAHPNIPVFLYENSGHGFNNAGTPDADPADAALARARTIALFARETSR